MKKISYIISLIFILNYTKTFAFNFEEYCKNINNSDNFIQIFPYEEYYKVYPEYDVELINEQRTILASYNIDFNMFFMHLTDFYLSNYILNLELTEMTNWVKIGYQFKNPPCKISDSTYILWAIGDTILTTVKQYVETKLENNEIQVTDLDYITIKSAFTFCNVNIHEPTYCQFEKFIMDLSEGKFGYVMYRAFGKYLNVTIVLILFFLGFVIFELIIINKIRKYKKTKK